MLNKQNVETILQYIITLHWTVHFCHSFLLFFNYHLLGTCTGRKRRSIQETIGKKFDFDIAPTQDVDISADDHIQDQPDSGLKNDEQLMENESQRTGRQNFFNFLLYWATTTTTITSNSTVNGIVTITLADGGCLPSGVSSQCA